MLNSDLSRHLQDLKENRKQELEEKQRLLDSLQERTFQSADQSGRAQQMQELLDKVLLSVPSSDPLNLSLNQQADPGPGSSFLFAPKRVLKKEVLQQVTIQPNVDEMYDKSVQVDLHEPPTVQPEEDLQMVLPPTEHIEAKTVKPLVVQAVDAFRSIQSTPPKEDVDPEDPQLLAFLDQASLALERVLGSQQVKAWEDYIVQENETENQAVTLLNEFQDPQLAGRCVHTLDFSPQFSDLFLTGLGEGGHNHFQGGLLLWSLHSPTRCQRSFQTNDRILEARFHPFDPNLLVCASYGGTISVWDLRVQTQVQRSSRHPNSHSHPVHGLEILGSQHSHQIVTLSSGGRLCQWDLSNLSSPQSFLDLGGSACISSLCQLKDQQGLLYGGTQEGSLLEIDLFGESCRPFSQNHQSAVTGVHGFQACQPGFDFEDLILSASMDMCVRLWSTKTLESLLELPICQDYLMDVEWHPQLPGRFALVDASGFLSVWDLNTCQNAPLQRVEVAKDLNRLKWHPGGHKVLVASTSGCLKVFETAHESGGAPDFENFQTTLEKLVAHRNLSPA